MRYFSMRRCDCLHKTKSLIILICTFGIFLRLFNLDKYGLWYDEVAWWMYPADQHNLLRWLKDSIWIGKPPLFRLLLCVWNLFVQGDFALKLLSVTFGSLSILITYMLGKVLFDKKTAITAMLLLAFSSFHIYYSQDLTHYALLMFLCLCSIYYLIRFLQKSNMFLLTKFVIAMVLSLYTGYSAFFLLLAANIFILLVYRNCLSILRRWLLSQIVIFVLYMPWLAILPQQFLILSHRNEFWTWIPRGSLLHMFQLFRIFNVGYSASFLIYLFVSLICLPLFLTGLWFTTKKKAEHLFLPIWLFVPPLLSLLFSPLFPTFTYRNFIICLPAFYLLVGYGTIKAKKFGFGLIVLLVILASTSLFYYYNNILAYPEDFYRPGVHARKDVRGMTEYIAGQLKEGDKVLHTSISTALPYLYYLFKNGYIDKTKLKDLRDYLYYSPIKDPTYDRNYTLDKRKYQLLIHNINDIKDIIGLDDKRLWLVVSAWEPQISEPKNDELVYKLKTLLNSEDTLLKHRQFTGIDIYLYLLQR